MGMHLFTVGCSNGSGAVATSTVDIYDVSTGTWNSTATGAGQLSVARWGLAAAAAGNKIVFAGGSYVIVMSGSVSPIII